MQLMHDYDTAYLSTNLSFDHGNSIIRIKLFLSNKLRHLK